MIDLDDSAGGAQRRLVGDFLHRQDRSDRNVVLVACIHDLELGFGHGPLLDGIEDAAQTRQPRRRRRVIGIGLPLRPADEIADRAPHRRLSNEIDVGVGVAFPAFAFENPAGLAAARIVAGARRRRTERDAFAILAVFGEWAVLEALLIAQFYAGKIKYAVLHGAEHLLATAGAGSLEERRYDTERQMQSGAGIADLSAGDERRPLPEAGGRGRTARALGDVLVHFTVLVRPRTEALDRRHDHTRVELMDMLERQTHAVERAGSEVLNEHIASLHQPVEHLLAFGIFGIDGDRAFAAVEHGEVEAVGALHVAQLAAGDVAHSRALDFDHVRAHEGEKLGAGWPRLHVREIEHANALKRPSRPSPRLR